MEVVKLNIIITPAIFKSSYKGCEYSNIEIIHVNTIRDKYIILFTDEEFKKVSPTVILNNIKNIIQSNLKNCEVIFTIVYDGDTGLDQKTLLGLLKLDDNLSKRPDSLYPMKYVPSNQLVELAQKVLMENSKSNNNSINRPKPELEKPKYRDQHIVEYDGADNIMKALYGDQSSFHNKKKRKKSNRRKKIMYTSSKVIRASSHPKRSYNRHGIIICKNNKAIRKDEEIIKDFLKEFIPGNSSFKKHLRKDMLKRWMSMYVITQKKANKMHKNYKRSLSNVSKQQKTEQIVNLTRKMLTVPVDSWNDPNR